MGCIFMRCNNEQNEKIPGFSVAIEGGRVRYYFINRFDATMQRDRYEESVQKNFRERLLNTISLDYLSTIKKAQINNAYT